VRKLTPLAERERIRLDTLWRLAADQALQGFGVAFALHLDV
jgi:hypothetical protein